MSRVARHHFVLLLSLVATNAFAAGAKPAGKVATYAYPPDAVADPEYRVEVNGREVFVWGGNPVASIAAFDLVQGPADVVIKPRRDARWVDVRPLARGVKAEISGGAIRFRLDRPGNFSVELNRAPSRRPLFLFANPPSAAPPKPGKGGKLIRFAAGKVHDAGLVMLKSGDVVHVEGGAIVKGALQTRGGEDVRIVGRGILDGTNNRQLQPRSRFVEMHDCKRLLLEGVVLSNSTTWQIVPINCDGVTVRNVKVVSDNGGDDGMDIVRSRDVEVDGAFFRTKDDCIAVKAIHNHPPEVTTRNVRVHDTVCWNAAWGNGFEIGFEMRAHEVSDLVFENNDMIHVETGAVFSIHNGDQATIRNVRFENIRVEDARQKLFDVAIFLTQYSHDRPANEDERKARYLHGAWDGVLSVDEAQRKQHAAGRGHVRDVLFKNIQIVDGPLPYSLFAGYDADHRIDGVTIENLTLRGKVLRSAAEANVTTEHADVRVVGGAPSDG